MAHDHQHGHEEHGHTHGAVDPSIATSERGMWAVKWSFVGLFVTALLQVVVVGFVGNEAVAIFRIRVGRQIGSAALIADGYHARTDG